MLPPRKITIQPTAFPEEPRDSSPREGLTHARRVTRTGWEAAACTPGHQ